MTTAIDSPRQKLNRLVEYVLSHPAKSGEDPDGFQQRFLKTVESIREIKDPDRQTQPRAFAHWQQCLGRWLEAATMEMFGTEPPDWLVGGEGIDTPGEPL